MIERRDVQFRSGDSYAAAWSFLPDQVQSGARVPAVAMAHGLGAVKEMYLEPFARRFAEAGIAALLFDYRFFGASGGEPRQKIFPRDQIEDYILYLLLLAHHYYYFFQSNGHISICISIFNIDAKN